MFYGIVTVNHKNISKQLYFNKISNTKTMIIYHWVVIFESKTLQNLTFKTESKMLRNVKVEKSKT
jgi:hypothetical protein